MEKCDDGTFKFGNNNTIEFAVTESKVIDGDRGEGMPKDELASVGGDEYVDGRVKTVAFRADFIKENDYDAGANKLENYKETDASTQILWVAIYTTFDVHRSLTESDCESND